MGNILRYIWKRLATAERKARLLAVLVFAAFAYLGVNDVLDLTRTLTNPEPMARQFGITLDESRIRAVVLLAFSAVIALASLATLLGAVQRTTLLRAWPVVAAGYVLYAVAQFALAALVLRQPLVAVPSLVYLLLAAAAYSFGRQASRVMDR